jgi:hypothetical protein
LDEYQLLALNRAWLITIIVITLFVWDRKTFDRTVEGVLLSNAL